MIEIGDSVLVQARHAVGLAEVHFTGAIGDYRRNVDRAIRIVEDAFVLLDEGEHNPTWVELATKLGIFYLLRYHGDKSRNGEKALNYFEMAEKYYDKDFRWGKLQESKGRAYLMQGNCYVDRALTLFESSLRFISKIEHPSYWVTLQINMARAYSLKEGLENRKIAHEHLGEAMRTLKECNLPNTDYHNACMDKIVGDLHMKGLGRQNLVIAIASYHKAIKIFNKKVFPLEHAVVLEALDAAKSLLVGEPRPEYRL